MFTKSIKQKHSLDHKSSYTGCSIGVLGWESEVTETVKLNYYCSIKFHIYSFGFLLSLVRSNERKTQTDVSALQLEIVKI